MNEYDSDSMQIYPEKNNARYGVVGTMRLDESFASLEDKADSDRTEKRGSAAQRGASELSHCGWPAVIWKQELPNFGEAT
ncbi:hypothetical protein [Candidatus Soleaferrea massiliensis]|uniref:hypothetical protein n=1 Tax=Candidatus Soleaferrea massiliensis TaxID=1470354 RepID=UPI00058DE8F8|nr:hypothetical protein [Candidatus Soleaferrea massiliensis]